jgi:hypothetical protein
MERTNAKSSATLRQLVKGQSGKGSNQKRSANSQISIILRTKVNATQALDLQDFDLQQIGVKAIHGRGKQTANRQRSRTSSQQSPVKLALATMRRDSQGHLPFDIDAR